MNTATGTKRQIMVQSGFRDMLELAGPLIVTDTGSGCLRGDGRGSKMSLGDMHRSTTGAGYTGAARGRGHRARSMCVHTTRLRWWRGSAGQVGV